LPFYNGIAQNHINIIHKTSECNEFPMYLVVFIPNVCYDFTEDCRFNPVFLLFQLIAIQYESAIRKGEFL